MITILLMILIASTVRKLKAVMIISVVMPILVSAVVAATSIDGARSIATLVITLPANIIVAFLTYKYCERKRKREAESTDESEDEDVERDIQELSAATAVKILSAVANSNGSNDVLAHNEIMARLAAFVAAVKEVGKITVTKGSLIDIYMKSLKVKDYGLAYDIHDYIVDSLLKSSPEKSSPILFGFLCNPAPVFERRRKDSLFINELSVT